MNIVALFGDCLFSMHVMLHVLATCPGVNVLVWRELEIWPRSFREAYRSDGIRGIPNYCLCLIRQAIRATFRRRQQRRLASLNCHTQLDRSCLTQVTSNDLQQKLDAIAPDLLLVHGTPILPQEILEVPKLGAVNLHVGMVPAYRGRDSLFWACYEGNDLGLGSPCT